MVDHATRKGEENTTHSERITYVIEYSSSWRQRPSCDLIQVLTLRESARSTLERQLIVRRNRHKV